MKSPLLIVTLLVLMLVSQSCNRNPHGAALQYPFGFFMLFNGKVTNATIDCNGYDGTGTFIYFRVPEHPDMIFASQYLFLADLDDYVIRRKDYKNIESSTIYLGEYCFVTTRKDSITTLHCRAGTSIAKKRDGPYIKLPCTQRELERVFGKPTSIDYRTQ